MFMQWYFIEKLYTCSLIADYERSVFSAGYFSDFLSAPTVESRRMNPNQKRLLKYNSMGLPGTWAQSCMGFFLFFFLFFFLIF